MNIPSAPTRLVAAANIDAPVAPVVANTEKPISNMDMKIHLSLNFDTYADPKNPGFITRESLRNVAYCGTQSGIACEHVDFARALLENHHLMEELDGYGKYKHDGKIDRASLDSAINPENNQFSSMSDEQLLRYGLDNFERFKEEPQWIFGGSRGVTTSSLTKLATSKTNDPAPKMFARELLSRPELVSRLGLDQKNQVLTLDSFRSQLSNGS